MSQDRSRSGPDQEGKVRRACLDAASRYLGYRARSEAELRRYLLKRGFDKRAVEESLSRLREKGLVDDGAFATSWASNRESFSPRSRAMIGRELREKGIDAETIAEVTADIDDDRGAYQAAQKKAKMLSTTDYETFRNRLSGFLRRRGFDWGVSETIVNRIWQERAEGRQDAQESSSR